MFPNLQSPTSSACSANQKEHQRPERLKQRAIHLHGIKTNTYHFLSTSGHFDEKVHPMTPEHSLSAVWLLLCVSNIECWKDVVCVKIFPLSIVTLSLLTARNPPRLISRLIFVWMCSIDSSPHLKLSNNLCGEGIRLHGFEQYYYWFSKQFRLL